MAFKKVAESLETLRRQVNEMAPGRDRSSDGALGDDSHKARKSDHNPNDDGVVCAVDITHDPAHGVDAGQLADMLRASKDPRIKYVISNARIFSSTKSPWEWRPYDGPNAHTKHVHVSVVGDKALYESTKPWAIDKVARIVAPLRAPSSKRCLNITATVFGGRDDENFSAYDEHLITDDELGLALPFRFKGKTRPKVRVFNSKTGASVDCDIVDVGPWNIDDSYWETDDRPQAETGIDRRGRPTNLAGIDLTPAAARAIGIDGKGKVDWEFIGASTVEPGVDTMATSPNDVTALLQQVLTVLQALQKQQPATPQPAQPQPQAAQADQLQKIVAIINAIANAGAAGEQKPMGSVNGALGETVGTMLDGKKTAIGLIGSLVTAVLPNLPGLSGALSGAVGLAAAPVAPIALPLFLAMTAWGVLGKLEKWSGNAAPPPPKK